MLLSEIQPGRRLIYDHTLVRGENTILDGRTIRRVGMAFFQAFPTPEGSNLCKEKVRIIPPLITLHYGPSRVRKIARAGARMDGIGRRRMALALEGGGLSRTDLRL